MKKDMIRYIRFDLETRNILGIDRNKPGLSSNYFEVPYGDVEQFITGDQNVANYYIEKDRNQSKYYIKLKRIDIAIGLIDDRLYKIPSKKNGDIQLINNTTTQTLTLAFDKDFRNYLLKKYDITEETNMENINIEGTQFLEFILCYDEDPHNRISYIRFPTIQLMLNEKLEVKYETKHKNLCVFTKRIYDDYAYGEQL